MTSRLSTAVIVAIVLVLSAVSPASAQQNPTGDVAISWGMLIHSDTQVPIGWVAAVAYHVRDPVSIVGEVNGNYKAETSETWGYSSHAFLGGARFRFGGSSKTRPFAQALAGVTKDDVQNQSSTTSFTLQPGGGVDIAIKPNMAFRVQADVRWKGGNTGNAIRVGAGVVFGFGGK